VRTPCPQWSAAQLLTHLWCTAERYHRLLDAALAGRPEPMPVNEELAALNEREVKNAASHSVSGTLALFESSATAYLERAVPHWRIAPFQIGGGCVGDAMGIAAIEWHIHAWDLSQAGGQDYRPDSAEVLRRCWVRAVPHLPIDRGGEPWSALLAAADRNTRTPFKGKRT